MDINFSKILENINPEKIKSFSEINENLKDVNLEGTDKSMYEKSQVDNTIPTRNGHLEGEKHPVTDVPFERKTVETPEGEKEGVFPVFESMADVQLPDELLEEKDWKQFDYCNEKLKEEIQSNPELKEKFTEEQLEQIDDGETPDGYTWHHNEEKGKMELVDSETHAKTGHTGGKSVWGGGSENR